MNNAGQQTARKSRLGHEVDLPSVYTCRETQARTSDLALVVERCFPGGLLALAQWFRFEGEIERVATVPAWESHIP